MDDDFMEIAGLGLIPVGQGWFFNADTNKYTSPEGEECNVEEYKALTKKGNDL